MKTYLIVEDDATKKNNYLKFGKHYGLKFILTASPRGAITWLKSNHEEAKALSGVIADFEVKGRRKTNEHVRIDVPGPDGADYPVSTGLGVLDWVHSMNDKLPLWSLTDVNASHAPLFMSAASLWLDAKPLIVERLYQCDTPLADGMAAELDDPTSYKTTNPTWTWVDNSRAAFNELLQTKHTNVEAFDWLNALTHLGRSTGFIPALTAAIRQVTMNQDVTAYANTLARPMAKWQLYLEEVYQDFPVDREEDRWPVLDADHLPTSIHVWESFNPITDFLGENPECKEFFEAADVNVAFCKWRARGDVA